MRTALMSISKGFSTSFGGYDAWHAEGSRRM